MYLCSIVLLKSIICELVNFISFRILNPLINPQTRAEEELIPAPRAYWHEGKLYYKGKVLLDNEVEETETTS